MSSNDENVKTAKADPFIGKVLDKYVLIERLGAGGMGTVYRAEQKHIKRQVAVKVLSMRLINDEINIRRIEREATSMGNLRHPNIATMFDFGFSEDGQPYMVMELINGRSLKQLLRESKYLSPQRALNIVSQIAEAMAYAHKHGIIHRDLKPDNVMLDIEHKEDFVKILDFGIAKQFNSEESMSLTQTGDVVGSPLYMSPEQCTGQPLDLRSDIYSTGIILYEAMTGIVPCQGATLFETIGKKTQEPPPPFPPHLAHLKDLENLTLACLGRYPEDRPPTMTALKEALDSLHTFYFGPIGGRSGSYSATGGAPYGQQTGTGSRTGDRTGNGMAPGERTSDGGSLSQYEYQNRDGSATSEGMRSSRAGGTQGGRTHGGGTQGGQTGNRTQDRSGYGTQDRGGYDDGSQTGTGQGRSQTRTSGGSTRGGRDTYAGGEDLNQTIGTASGGNNNKQFIVIGLLIAGLWVVVGAAVVFFCFTLNQTPTPPVKTDNGTTDQKPADVVLRDLDKPTNNEDTSNKTPDKDTANNNTDPIKKTEPAPTVVVKKTPAPVVKKVVKTTVKTAKTKKPDRYSRNTYNNNYYTYQTPTRNSYSYSTPTAPQAPVYQEEPPAQQTYRPRKQNFSDGSEFGGIYQNQRQSEANGYGGSHGYMRAMQKIENRIKQHNQNVNRGGYDPNPYNNQGNQYGY